MSYTKKVGSQRCMKRIEVWYGLNKSTPDQWFKRWEQFLVPLMEEIGYRQQTNPPIQKKRGKAWTKELTFTHPSLENTTLFLSRKRRQQGGKIHFVYGLAYDVVIDTLSSTTQSYEVMSRTKVGDAILNHVREGWSKSREAKQED